MEIYVECTSSTQKTALHNNKCYKFAGEAPYKEKVFTKPIYFNKDQKVPNDYERGYLIHNGSEWDFVLPQTYVKFIRETREKEIKKLILILESPHKDEYDRVGTQYFPLLPAMGVTGFRIRGGIASNNRPYIKSLNPSFDYKVILINAVQYQCSCYNYIMITKMAPRLRDQVFDLLFRLLSSDFIGEVRSQLDVESNIVVNACTIGGTTVPKDHTSFVSKQNIKFDLRKIVGDCLNNCGISFIVDDHPSTWN